MGNIGDPITPSIPPVGSPGPGFATDIDAILTEVVARLSAKVPLASISTNSTLNMTGSPITNVGYLTIADAASTPGVSPVNRLTTFAGNLYYVSPSGVIQLTTGGLLNSAAIGGITGDYGGANPAQFRFVDANQRYDAYDDFGGGAWAFIRARGIDIAAGATSALSARLLFAGAASKTYTLPPAAATTGDRPLYMDSSGNITVGHGAKNLSYPAIGLIPEATGASPLALFVLAGNQCGVQNATAGAVAANKPLDNIPIGYAFTSVTVHLNKTNANSFSAALFKQNGTGNATQLATNSSSAVGAVSLSLTPGATQNVASGDVFWVQVTFSSTAFAQKVMSFEVVGSMPA